MLFPRRPEPTFKQILDRVINPGITPSQSDWLEETAQTVEEQVTEIYERVKAEVEAE